MKKTIAAVALSLCPTLCATAIAREKGTPPDLATYNDAQTKVSFQYPKSWRVITIADDASKAEAKNESGRSKLTIEAVLAAPGDVTPLLKQRLPNGQPSSVGDWKCLETDTDEGKGYAAYCGHHVKGKEEEVLIIGISSSQNDFGGSHRREFIVKKLGTTVSGFHAGE